MKADFQYLLSKYLTEYLKNECGASDNTIHSYRDTFVLLLRFFQKSFQIESWKLRLEDLTPDTVQCFLDTIEAKGQTISTRNQRQAAIHSFIKYASSELPQNLDSFKKILDMPIKKASSPNIQYIKGEHIKLFLNVINTQSRKGYRDYMMMTFMLFCGLRVSEVICIKKSDRSLSKPYTMMIHGKGNKIRIIPLVDLIADQLRTYLVSFSFCNKTPISECQRRSSFKASCGCDCKKIRNHGSFSRLIFSRRFKPTLLKAFLCNDALRFRGRFNLYQRSIRTRKCPNYRNLCEN
ncbi:hypothetical protein IGI52_000504 [Enterococcus sp. DIV0187]